MLELTNHQLASNFSLNINPLTREDIDAIIEQRKCPLYCSAPSHPKANFMCSCDKLKKYGYKTTYNPAEDQTRKDDEKKRAQRVKFSALDVVDAKKDEELKKINNKKS